MNTLTTKMNIIDLSDVKPTPDATYPYSTKIRNASLPLVIDNGKIFNKSAFKYIIYKSDPGSYQCRVGWSCDPDPILEFRNLIAKPRKDRNKKDTECAVTPPIQIGNDILNIEAMRFQLKTQVFANQISFNTK